MPGIALVVGLAVMPIGRAAAQSFTILHSFGILTNVTGINPRSTLVQGADGTLYGTTSGGEGNVLGTVFKVRPDGTGFAVLKRFTSPLGGNPWVGLTLSDRTLYGTTTDNRYSSGGTVFSINTDGTGYTVLYNFTNSPDGAFPSGALTLSGNTLYGTTVEGGSSGNGTVFKLNTDGSAYTVLYNFTNSPDGVNPSGKLALSGSTLYGTTGGGGNSNGGTVFSVNTDGTGYTVLYSFTNSPDGALPSGALALSGSTLYGTTGGGGKGGYGTVFKVNTDATGYTVLYNFADSPDGANPWELTLTDSTLYGTTYDGGSSNSGTVFKLNTDGTGYSVLYSFTGSSDGGVLAAGVMLSGSTLYGTANQGGSSGDGTVFSINTDGTGYTVLKSFTHSTDGAGPEARLTVSGNTLYGTTVGGGSSNEGMAFKVATDGTGYTALWNFTGGPADGAYPNGELALSGSTLYGTTPSFGSWDGGTVFSINTDGTGYAVLYNFDAGANFGGEPQTGLILSGSTLYGATPHGGSLGYGTLFKLKTDGSTYTVMQNFNGWPDGAVPCGRLALSGSRLYGTTFGVPGQLIGTVFSINTDGSAYTVMHYFTGSSGTSDGAGPSGELALSGSTLYGTTSSGGRANDGTVFKINTDATGYTVLKSFTNSPGWAVFGAGLTLSGSTLYGTTPSGGSSNFGTVFKLNTDGTGYAVVKSFTGPPDGAYPLGGLILLGSTLYGTTAQGGDLDEGTIFSLNLAPVLNIARVPGTVVLSWADPAFNLQSAPEATGPYTNIPGATSPYTSVITGGRQFFRLARP